jgi:hypothetical protein
MFQQLQVDARAVTSRTFLFLKDVVVLQHRSRRLLRHAPGRALQLHRWPRQLLLRNRYGRRILLDRWNLRLLFFDAFLV